MRDHGGADQTDVNLTGLVITGVGLVTGSNAEDKGGCTYATHARGDSPLAGLRRLHVFSFQESPVLVQKAASGFCLRKRSRISTDNHVPRPTLGKPALSLSRKRATFLLPRSRCISFRSHTTSRTRICLVLPGPAKLARRLPARAASGNVVTGRAHVKRSRDTREKNFRIFRRARVTSPRAVDHRALASIDLRISPGNLVRCIPTLPFEVRGRTC